MLVLGYARERVKSFMREIEHLRESDFPHVHSREALDLIAQMIGARSTTLEGLSAANSDDVVKAACSEAFVQIYNYHPLLGFMLRSTNIRNSFEIYRPILTLCKKILGNDTKLVLSSEWEFSPFVFKPIADLPNFVLMGLPACESGNPLLTPLAGHELGHTTWNKKSVGVKYSPKIEEAIYQKIEGDWVTFQHLFNCNVANLRYDLFAARKLALYHFRAMQQAEESFCDFMGIRIFAESYLHAFAYLVAPGDARVRPDEYPKTATRIANMINAGGQYGTQIPPGYTSNFSDQLNSGNIDHDLLMSIADHAVSTVISDLIQEADSIVSAAGVAVRDEALIQKACASYRLVVPASGVGSLANILNAGWHAYNDSTLWQGRDEILAQRNHILYDILLKSIEVLEFETITSAAPGATP